MCLSERGPCPRLFTMEGQQGRTCEGEGAFTFVQPVAQAVEHHALFPGGHQANGSVVHRGSVVNVVLKDENLHREKRSSCQALCVKGIFNSHTQTLFLFCFLIFLFGSMF